MILIPTPDIYIYTYMILIPTPDIYLYDTDTYPGCEAPVSHPDASKTTAFLEAEAPTPKSSLPDPAPREVTTRTTGGLLQLTRNPRNCLLHGHTNALITGSRYKIRKCIWTVDFW